MLGRYRSTNRHQLERTVAGGGHPVRRQGVRFHQPISAEWPDETALVHAKFARRQVQLGQIAVVVSYHHDRYTRLLQLGQQFIIEFASKVRILVGSPFIQQQDRALLQQTHDEGQALALSTREVERAEFAVAAKAGLF